MTGVQVVRLVARREFVERARDRSFLVSTGITVLILLAVVLVPPLLAGDDEDFVVGTVGGASQAVLDRAGPGIQRRVLPDRDAAERGVRDGDLDAAVVDGEIVVDEELDGTLGLQLQNGARALTAEQRLRAAGIDPTAVTDALQVEALPVRELAPRDPDADANRGIAFVGVFVLYGQLIGYGFWVALGVVEEKSSRVVEVLLSTIRPWQLLAGKVIGIGLLGLGQLLLTAVVGLTAALVTDVVDLPASAILTVAQVVGWFVLGYAFFAVAFAAAAATVSRQEELQNVTTPLTLLVLVGFFIAIFAAQDRDSTLATVASYVPPVSALVMPPRVAAGGVAAWEVALAVALMLLATGALTVAAGRLYAGAVLRTGARVKLGEAWRSRR